VKVTRKNLFLTVVAIVAFAVMATGCGSSIGESRLAYYPAREAGCQLQFVQQDMNQMGPTGPWEVVGYVTISETGVADPFSQEYREIVRPRACGMGGEAVTIIQSTTNQTAMASGSATIYCVLRRRQAGVQPSAQF
jgi:hypothetical protein